MRGKAVSRRRCGKGKEEEGCDMSRVRGRARGFRFGGMWRSASIEVAVGEGGFVEAEVVAEFVEVGAADFFFEGGAGVFAFFEDVFEVEENLRGRAGVVDLFVARGADEESEDAGVESVINQRFVGIILETDGHLTGGVAEFGGEAVEGLHDDAAGGGVVAHAGLRDGS